MVKRMTEIPSRELVALLARFPIHEETLKHIKEKQPENYKILVKEAMSWMGWK